jgi:hypothetical protein
MITNKHNLPTPIFNAVNREYKPNPERFSVTDLIGPPLIRHLKLKHWEELSEDASDRLWMLLGSAVDYIISKHAEGHIMVQAKFEVPIDGIVVVGKPDIFYLGPGEVQDWKVTSVWSFLLGDKKDWERQLNCYAWGIFKSENMLAQQLTINAILRDWQKSKMMQNQDYPRIPFVTKNIPLWPFEEQEAYIKQQLEYHRMSEPKECSSEDKWEKPTTYAVTKKGRKSALRVLDSRSSAGSWCIDNGHATNKDAVVELTKGIEIVKRPGECVRCLNYCPVRTVCEYAKENA